MNVLNPAYGFIGLSPICFWLFFTMHDWWIVTTVFFIWCFKVHHANSQSSTDNLRYFPMCWMTSCLDHCEKTTHDFCTWTQKQLLSRTGNQYIDICLDKEKNIGGISAEPPRDLYFPIISVIRDVSASTLWRCMLSTGSFCIKCTCRSNRGLSITF